MDLSVDDLQALGKGEGGVSLWWLKLDAFKAPVTCLAWPSLVLLHAKPSWPPGSPSESLQGEPGDSYRISYVKGLGKLLARPGVPVPDLAPYLTLQRGSCKRLHLWRPLRGGYLGLSREPKTPPTLKAWRKHVLRICDHLGADHPRDLEIRLAPESAVALVYAGRHLRAVTSLVEHAP